MKVIGHTATFFNGLIQCLLVSIWTQPDTFTDEVEIHLFVDNSHISEYHVSLLHGTGWWGGVYATTLACEQRAELSVAKLGQLRRGPVGRVASLSGCSKYRSQQRGFQEKKREKSCQRSIPIWDYPTSNHDSQLSRRGWRKGSWGARAGGKIAIALSSVAHGWRSRRPLPHLQLAL